MPGPGKFEGEPKWVEEMWDEAGGMTDPENEFTTGDGFFTAITLEPQDKEKFPALASEYGVIMHEDTQGFVTAELYDNEQAFNEAVDELREIQSEWLGDDDNDTDILGEDETYDDDED